MANERYKRGRGKGKRTKFATETMSYTDEDILSSLQRDREEGAAMLMEEYAGLLWSVCQKHLEDPEDIRECVNSVFADFCLNFEKFDAKKASLKTYLCRIAHNKAIDCYQENCRRRKVQDRVEDRIQGESTEDLFAEHLNEALEQLESIDSQILRMKYYDGLSYQEIAKKLDLKETAVKMRSMRSRRKLVKILIAIITALLLAACAAMVFKHYQFSEYGGVVWSDKAKMYELDDGDYVWEEEDLQLEVTEAIFVTSEEDAQSGTVTIYLNVNFPGNQNFAEYEEKEKFLEQVSQISNQPNAALHVFKRYWDDAQNCMKYEMEMEWQMENADQESITMPLYQGETYLMDINLHAAELREFEAASKSINFMENLEWLLGPVLSGEDFTVVDLSQWKESDWSVSPQFTSSRYTQAGVDQKPIVLIGTDGTEYDMRYGRIDSYPLNDGAVFEQCNLYFPSLPSGVYTLRIPYVFLKNEQTSETFTLTLPKEEDQPLACDVTARFTEDSGIHIRSITKQEYVQITYEQEAGSSDLIEKETYYWEYALKYETFSSGNPSFHMAMLEYADGRSIQSGIAEENTISVWILQGEEPEEIALRFSNPEYILDKKIELDVTVHSSEE